MIAIIGLYLVMVGYSLYLMTKVVRTSAGFLTLALYGVKFAWLGPIPMAHFAITTGRRVRNMVAALVYPVIMTAFFLLVLYWLASMLASIV